MSLGNREILAANLKKHIASSGKDRKDIVNELGFSYSTFTDWINAKKYPRIEKIEKLAEYFNITKSELIEDFEQKKKDNDVLATIIVKLRTDKELFEIAEKLIYLDKAKLNSLNRMLDTFI